MVEKKLSPTPQCHYRFINATQGNSPYKSCNKQANNAIEVHIEYGYILAKMV